MSPFVRRGDIIKMSNQVFRQSALMTMESLKFCEETTTPISTVNAKSQLKISNWQFQNSGFNLKVEFHYLHCNLSCSSLVGETSIALLE